MKKLALAFTSILSLGACLDDETTAPVIQEDPEITSTTRIAINGLYPDTAWSVLDSTPLSAAKITSTSIAAFLDDPYERATLSYVVRCALATGNSFSAGGYTFQGQVGLAPNWKTTAVTSAQGKQVAGCFWSLLNSTGTTITVSLRGTGISVSPSESTTYPLEEGAFGGNVFSTFGAVVGAACMGADQAAGESGGSLPYRECTEADPANPGSTVCGLVDLGLCSSVCTSNGAGAYSSCGSIGSPVSAFVAN